MNSPKISVIMSVFNGEGYLDHAIKSILNQSYENFELLIINDGSTDNTSSIIERFSENDDRIKVYHSRNKGLIFQLNYGIELAEGEWIARMDADDISEKHRFRNQLTFLVDNDLDFCGTWYKVIDGEGDIRDRVETPVTHKDVTLTLARRCPFAHGSVMGKARFFRELKYCENDYTAVEDFIFGTECSMRELKWGTCLNIYSAIEIMVNLFLGRKLPR